MLGPTRWDQAVLSLPSGARNLGQTSRRSWAPAPSSWKPSALSLPWDQSLQAEPVCSMESFASLSLENVVCTQDRHPPQTSVLPPLESCRRKLAPAKVRPPRRTEPPKSAGAGGRQRPGLRAAPPAQNTGGAASGAGVALSPHVYGDGPPGLPRGSPGEASPAAGPPHAAWERP